MASALRVPRAPPESISARKLEPGSSICLRMGIDQRYLDWRSTRNPLLLCRNRRHIQGNLWTLPFENLLVKASIQDSVREFFRRLFRNEDTGKSFSLTFH